MLAQTFHYGKEKIYNIVSRVSSKDFCSLLFSSFMHPVINIINAFLVTRFFMVDEGNLFFLLFSIALLCTVISDFGLRPILYLEAGRIRDISERLTFVSNIISVRILLGILAVICFFIFAHLSLTEVVDIRILIVFALYAANMHGADTNLQILRGFRCPRFEPYITSVEIISLAIGIGLIFALNIKTCFAVAIVFCVAAILRFIVSYIVLGHVIGHYFILPDWSEMHLKIWRGVIPGLSLIAAVMLLRLPILIAPRIGLGEYIALLSVMFMLLQRIQLFSATWAAVEFPKLLQDKKLDVGLLKSVYKEAMSQSFLVGLVVFAGIFIFGRIILNVFNPNYGEYAMLLSILAIFCPIYMLNDASKHIFSMFSALKIFLILQGFSLCVMCLSLYIFSVMDIGVWSIGLAFMVGHLCLSIGSLLLIKYAGKQIVS